MTENGGKNGTLNLLRKMLPEGKALTSRDLHSLRREFMQKVFTFYILRPWRDDADGRLIINDRADEDDPRNGDLSAAK